MSLLFPQRKIAETKGVLELEILIALIVVGAILLFGLQNRKADHSSPPPDDIEPDPPRRPRPQRRPRPTSFDAESATPEPRQTFLTGPAYVIDGDTIVVQKTQIRLFGVDAPEMNHPYGKKAKWALVALCKGQTIKAEVTATDDHGRTVAKCYLEDGRDLSAEMVKQGLAIDWPKFSGGKYRDLEVPGVRKKLWLADARQKGRMHVWESFEAKQAARNQEK